MAGCKAEPAVSCKVEEIRRRDVTLNLLHAEERYLRMTALQKSEYCFFSKNQSYGKDRPDSVEYSVNDYPEFQQTADRSCGPDPLRKMIFGAPTHFSVELNLLIALHSHKLH